MARKRTRMKRIRDVIRFRLENGLSERQVSRALKLSRTVVARTLSQFRASGLSWPLDDALSDTELEQRLWQKDPLVRSPRYRALEERFPAMVLELRKKGMTLEWLWERYREEHPDGYQYSQFCGHFQRWSEAGELWMHQSYKAGECVFVDWAGDLLEVVNAQTGQPWLLSVYVGILGASGLTWAQATESQEQPYWIRCNEGALRYFGGSPDALIPDNLRQAVNKSDRYEPQINPIFEEFALHYHLAVFPARVPRAFRANRARRPAPASSGALRPEGHPDGQRGGELPRGAARGPALLQRPLLPAPARSED
jgi:transposase